MNENPNYRFSYKFKEDLKLKDVKPEVEIENFNPVGSSESSPKKFWPKKRRIEEKEIFEENTSSPVKWKQP